jgi:hypothetical protein
MLDVVLPRRVEITAIAGDEPALGAGSDNKTMSNEQRYGCKNEHTERR